MKTLTRLVERRQGDDRYINLRRAEREGEGAIRKLDDDDSSYK